MRGKRRHWLVGWLVGWRACVGERELAWMSRG